MKKGKKVELIKWILLGLVILAVLFFAFKIFFTGQVVSSTGSQLICSLGYISCFDTGISYSCYLGNTCPSNQTSNVTTSNQTLSTNYTTSTNFTGGYSITVHPGDFIYFSNGNYTIKLFSTANISNAGATFDPSKYRANFVNIADYTQFNVIWNSAGVGTLTFPNGYSYSVIMTGNSINSSSQRSVTISSLQYPISCVSGSCSPTSPSNQTKITNQSSTSDQNCFSAGQSGCLLDRSKSCCAGLTCQGSGQGTCAPAPTCTPKTCLNLGKKCGSVSDTCGGTLNCGTCSSKNVCVNGNCLGGYGDYCTTGSQCSTGRCKPLSGILWWRNGNYCY